MKIESPPDHKDSSDMPEIFVDLITDEIISVRSDSADLSLLLFNSFTLSKLLDKNMTILRTSLSEFHVKGNRGICMILDEIRRILDINKYYYSEPFIENLKSENHLFRMQINNNFKDLENSKY
jgi:hypothetical protein